MFNFLNCRQVHECTFPTVFQIAMDYLPIQASTVPCERVFSSSAETDTKKRNRIRPELMEATQILKFALKKSCLNFTAHLQLPKHSMSRDGPDPTDTLTDMLKMNPDALQAFLQTLNLCNWIYSCSMLANSILSCLCRLLVWSAICLTLLPSWIWIECTTTNITTFYEFWIEFVFFCYDFGYHFT